MRAWAPAVIEDGQPLEAEAESSNMFEWAVNGLIGFSS